MEQGLLHLYWGDGKGKTTAAMGLALRALGHGRRVVILQFLKDGSSGEIEMLRRCGAAVYACPNAKFTWLMTDAERAEARRTNTRTLQTILQGSFDLLVLDEACAACKNDLVEEALLREAAARAEQGAEVVLTGREPAAWMQDAADYSDYSRELALAASVDAVREVLRNVGIDAAVSWQNGVCVITPVDPRDKPAIEALLAVNAGELPWRFAEAAP